MLLQIHKMSRSQPIDNSNLSTDDVYQNRYQTIEVQSKG
jgi:hypothetical protein